jgi:hypothetical protein
MVSVEEWACRKRTRNVSEENKRYMINDQQSVLFVLLKNFLKTDIQIKPLKKPKLGVVVSVYKYSSNVPTEGEELDHICQR